MKINKNIVDKLLSKIKKPRWIEWEKKTDKHNKCQEQDSWQVSEQYNKTHWIKWTRKQTSNRAK